MGDEKQIPALIRAAEYVRMSTDDQKYSPVNQSEAIRIYAAKRGMKIVRTYSDDGKSGLNLDGRDALKQLIEDVQSGNTDFTAILVYDVSRWGRFQDADEAAYYEYACRRVGIALHYCAEQFENDGSPLAAIVKGIKRAMAGEYSRELSVKVFAGQRRIVELGFRLGGSAGYGLRRLLIDQNGVAKFELRYGEQKSIATDRVILVPGPPEEVAIVRWIYSSFVHERKAECQIADLLNKCEVTNDYGRPWRRHTIKQILRNEKYIGNSIWNRSSFKLQKVRFNNNPETWLRIDGAFEAIVDLSLFQAAQAIYRDRLKNPIRGRGRTYSDDQMLEQLRRLFERRRDLTSKIIDECEDTQSAGAYAGRFGSLTRAYELVGFIPEKRRKRQRNRPYRRRLGLSDNEMLDSLRELLQTHGYLSEALLTATTALPSHNSYRKRFGSLLRAYQLVGYTPDLLRKRSPRPRGLSDEEMLRALRELLRERGRLSQSIIDENEHVPSAHAYHKRFGGLLRAYPLIGYRQKNARRNPPSP